MRALCLTDSVDSPSLAEVHVDNPQPGRGELMIRVHAAGVTPTELLWYPTSHTKSGEKRRGAVPGHEFSGVVAAIGDEVSGFQTGQEVFGMNDWFADGAMAEYCLTVPSSIAPKPRGLTHAQCASVPIGALTAWQGLFDRAKLQARERVLVHGGAGSVGAFAVQLAHLHGAVVIATASARNLEYVSQLGAGQVIDYRAARFEDSVSDLDVVFDTVGGQTLDHSWKLLKPGGRMVTVAAGDESTREQRVKDAFFIVEPNAKELIEIGHLLETGRLQAPLDAVVPFARAASAFTGQFEKRQGRGKLVVAVMEAGITGG